MTGEDDGHSKGLRQDYEIGFGRPPKNTQFTPGQSGNPKGRKRQPKSVQAQMQTIVEKKVRINEGGKTKSLPILTVILRTFANKAVKGDQRAAEFIVKLLYAPEYANADAIDQASLSSADQAMLNEVMQRLTDTDGTIQSISSNSSDVVAAETEPLAEDDETRSAPQDSAGEDEVNDE